MAGNSTLGAAKTAKKDEFYTQLADIENELRHYRQHFKGKTVLCNCDDPFESNFFKYFALNFNRLGLKKLIATSYVSSPVAGNQFRFHEDSNGQMTFSFGEDTADSSYRKHPYKAVMTSLHDATGNGGIEMIDVAKMAEKGEIDLEELQGDGDFRSSECLALLDEADIVVTNPPFSLFREYMAMLMERNKKFVIIGTHNAIHYKEIFPLLKDNKIWLGYGFSNGNAYFSVPPEAAKNYAKGVYDSNTGLVKFRNCCWFTNLDIKKRHEDLILVRRYDSKQYPKYSNFNGIDVAKVVDIPCDYDGMMGVPDTFMDKYNPDQFEIIGVANVNGLLDDVDIVGQKWIDEYKANGGTGHITANMHSLVGYNENGKPVSYYSRIIIRNKHPEQPREVQ